MVNVPATCTVFVTDISPGTTYYPTGLVTFDSDHSGTFTGSQCALMQSDGPSASCSVTYTPGRTAPRTDTITASYDGEPTPVPTHGPSRGTASVEVKRRESATSVSCNTPILVSQT